jgi:hypothetical protein
LLWSRTFNFEKALLDGLETQSRQAASADLDKAISQLPTEAPKPVESGTKPQLTITSEPTGAEIEIDGEFIGNTPTTVTAKEGSVTVKVKRAGFQPWERTLKLNPGDKVRMPMMSISYSDPMPIRSERSDAGLSQCEIVIGISQDFCLFSLS